MLILRLSALLALAALLFAPRVTAEDATSDAWKDDHFKLRVGTFLSFFDTDLRVDGRGGILGTSIDLESDLDLDEFTFQPAAGLEWKISRRQRLELSYFGLHRSANRILSTDINFGDETFTLGTNVHSDFDLDILRLGYSVMFVQDEKKEIGATLGVFGMRVKLGIESTRGILSETEEFGLPLPSVGIRGAYRFRDKWTFNGRAELFYMVIDDYEGNLISADLLFERQLSQHTSIGFGYSFFRLEVDSEGEFFRGSFDFLYHGPSVFMGFNF